MKAIVAVKYGSPDVLQLQKLEKPKPKDNEVLIRIKATIVSPVDCGFRQGKPLITRLFSGLIKPKFIPGDVLAGEIEDVGKDVTLFKKGDQVFGTSGIDFGTNAEYKCLPETEGLAVKPSNMSYGEAASVCDGGLTALPFLRENANIQKGQTILINGASGAVGTFAVQLASSFGAEVTGVCSTANLEMVKSLGANEVIDYTQTDFTKSDRTYDIIFDAVGKSSFFHCKNSLKQNGVYLTTVPTVAIMLQMLWTSKISSKKAMIAFTGLRSPGEKIKDLEFLKDLIESGKIKSVIDRQYPLEQIAEAHRYVDKGHKKGNVLITLE